MSTRSLESIRTAIVGKITGAMAGVMAYDHEVWVTMPDKFNQLFVTNSAVNVVFSALKYRREEVIVPNKVVQTTFDFEICCFRSFANDTRVTFEDELEPVLNAFRADSTLGGKCRSSGWRDPQADWSQSPVMLSKVMCHQVKLNFWALIRQKKT